MENYFVNRRKLQKAELERIMNENPDMDEDKVVAIFARRTGLKHSTIRMMLDELKAEMVLDV